MLYERSVGVGGDPSRGGDGWQIGEAAGSRRDEVGRYLGEMVPQASITTENTSTSVASTSWGDHLLRPVRGAGLIGRWEMR